MHAISRPLSARQQLFLTIAMIAFLSLLITVSFKIIALGDFVFTASSLLCPLVAGLYLVVLRKGDKNHQQQWLNQALFALYLFSIGIYILVSLPALENSKANLAYEVFFEDIPRKFFASTLSFALSFYLPFILVKRKKSEILHSGKCCLLLAFMAGILFFTIDFMLLFADPIAENFLQLYWNSFLVCMMGLLLVLMAALMLIKIDNYVGNYFKTPCCYASPLYHYLLSFSVTVLLVCLACEYRLISFGNSWVFVASGILFPLNFIISNVVGELYGYKANLRLVAILLCAELLFNAGLTGIMGLPSPDFFDLSSFYTIIHARRIPATTIALILAMGSNVFLLEQLHYKNKHNTAYLCYKIFVANIISNTLLCFVNYSLLFVGIYPYEKILNLALGSCSYKFLITVLSLPLVLWLFAFLRERSDMKFA